VAGSGGAFTAMLASEAAETDADVA
jgi:hypothetical protein